MGMEFKSVATRMQAIYPHLLSVLSAYSKNRFTDLLLSTPDTNRFPSCPNSYSGGVVNVAAAIVFIIIDSLAVFLRLLLKSKTKHYFSSDDWWILSALLFFFAWVGRILYSGYPTQRS